MDRKAFIDNQALAKGFETGDLVRKPGLRGHLLSPYVGQVVYSNTDTGVVHVQWPWGPEQESASELIKDVSETLEAPELSFDETWESIQFVNDKETLKEDEKWRKSVSSTISARHEQNLDAVRLEAMKSIHHGFSESEAAIRISSALFNDFSDEDVSRIVHDMYDHGRRLAIYWKDSKRRYKVTQKERQSGILFCPRCRGTLKPRAYRQGRRILSCKSCGFSIHPKDVK
jgi:hypothetical protein